MPALLLANWRLIAEALVAGALVLWLGLTKYELNSLHLQIANQKIEAQKLIADKQAEIAKTEAETAAHNDQLEADNAKKTADIVAAHIAFERDLAIKLRESRSRPSCTATGSTQTPSAGEHQELDPGSIVISGDGARSLGDAADRADKTDAVMAECKAWALEHGRTN